MNETTYIIRRNKLNTRHRKYIKAKKALNNNEIDKKDFDLILGEYNALCKMYRTVEYINFQDERRG